MGVGGGSAAPSTVTQADLRALGVLKGTHDASGGTFPAGADSLYDFFQISVAGTLPAGVVGGTDAEVGDSLIALTAAPAAATDWQLIKDSEASAEGLHKGFFDASSGGLPPSAGVAANDFYEVLVAGTLTAGVQGGTNAEYGDRIIALTATPAGAANWRLVKSSSSPSYVEITQAGHGFALRTDAQMPMFGYTDPADGLVKGASTASSVSMAEFPFRATDANTIRIYAPTMVETLTGHGFTAGEQYYLTDTFDTFAVTPDDVYDQPLFSVPGIDTIRFDIARPLAASGPAGANTITVSEADGTPNKVAVEDIQFPDGSVTVVGSTAQINIAGGGGGTGDVLADGSVPFTGTQAGVDAVAATDLTTLQQMQAADAAVQAAAIAAAGDVQSDGSVAFTATQTGVDGVAATDLATKGQVDAAQAAAELASAPRDGSADFTGTVGGVNAVAATDFPTLGQAQALIAASPDGDVKSDGSVAFTATQTGVDGVAATDLATKGQVDAAEAAAVATAAAATTAAIAADPDDIDSVGDGTTTVANVTDIRFTGATVSDGGGGTANVSIASAAGGDVMADGSVPFTATQTGVDGVAATDLATKGQVDAAQAAAETASSPRDGSADFTGAVGGVNAVAGTDFPTLAQTQGLIAASPDGDVKSDGSVAFTATQTGVDAVAATDLTTLQQLQAGDTAAQAAAEAASSPRDGSADFTGTVGGVNAVAATDFPTLGQTQALIAAAPDGDVKSDGSVAFVATQTGVDAVAATDLTTLQQVQAGDTAAQAAAEAASAPRDGSADFTGTVGGVNAVAATDFPTLSQTQALIAASPDGDVKSDGSVAFVATQTGVDAVAATDLTTLQQMQAGDAAAQAAAIAAAGDVQSDGSVAFTAVQSGITPTADAHLATKKYVDDQLPQDRILSPDGTTSEVRAEDGNQVVVQVDTTTALLRKGKFQVDRSAEGGNLNYAVELQGSGTGTGLVQLLRADGTGWQFYNLTGLHQLGISALNSAVPGNKVLIDHDAPNQSLGLTNGVTEFRNNEVEIRGAGNTGATISLRVRNSDGTLGFRVLDDQSAQLLGYLAIGQLTAVAKLDIRSDGDTNATNAIRARNSTGSVLLLLDDSGQVSMSGYPQTRDDTGATPAVNQLYTDATGRLLSAPVGGFNLNAATITAATTGAAGVRYPVDTTGGSFTFSLPAGPSTGDRVSIVDAAASFGTNALTVDPNGSFFHSAAGTFNLNTDNEVLTVVFVGGTIGWMKE